MFKRIIFLSAVLFLVGCGESYWRYCASDEQTEKDTAECHKQALKTVPPDGSDYAGVHTAEKACMELRGYHSSITRAPFAEERCGEREE